MALSDDQIVNIWGREPRYHAAPIGSTDIAFARAIEAEVLKRDEALIRQLVAALEGYRRNHNDTQPCDAERAGRSRLEGKP